MVTTRPSEARNNSLPLGANLLFCTVLTVAGYWGGSKLDYCIPYGIQKAFVEMSEYNNEKEQEKRIEDIIYAYRNRPFDKKVLFRFLGGAAGFTLALSAIVDGSKKESFEEEWEDKYDEKRPRPP